jgi:ribosome-associated protein
MAEKRAKTARSRKTVSQKPAAKSTRAPAKKAAKPVKAAKTAKTVKSAKTAKVAKSAVAKSPKTVAKKATKKVAAPARKPRATVTDGIVQVVKNALEDIKAVNVTVLDVRDLTDIADTLIIASGNSDRHVRSIADRVVEFAKKAGHRPLGVEGERDGEWVLVDLHDVIVHIMLPRVREFYRLESLWDVRSSRREAAAAGE